jgi:hypothetical protein
MMTGLRLPALHENQIESVNVQQPKSKQALGQLPLALMSPQPMPAHTPQFGNAAMLVAPALALSPLTKLFSFFESSYEMGFVLVSKVIGNAFPRIAITRSWDERKEVAFNEFTHTLGFFGALPIVSRLMDPIQAFWADMPKDLIRMHNDTAFSKLSGEMIQKLKVAKLGKSFGAGAIIASLMMVMPYWRNYRTINRTGFADYKKVVALGGKQTPTESDLAEAKVANEKNVKIIKGILVGGLLASLGIMAGAGLLARRASKLLTNEGMLNPQRLGGIFKEWGFVGKNSDQFNALEKSVKQTFWLWGVPSYIGWFLGCRDGYEFMEQVSKFSTFILGYVATPKIFKAIMEFKDKKLLEPFKNAQGLYALPSYDKIINVMSKENPELAQKMLSHLNTRKGVSLVGNLFAIGVLPILFNIWFSNWRYQRENIEPVPPSQPFHHPGGYIQHKPFGAWAQQQQPVP